MCGIIGYIGKHDALPVLIHGLKKLEYRGYDSSGVGVLVSGGSEIVLRKTQGKIFRLEELLRKHPLPPATLGLSHTRWATHGIPNHVNAHPHADCHQRILLVHNGIIENYEELKNRLIRRGHQFRSQTDTEVIAHLIEEYREGRDFVTAVRRAIQDLQGAFALGIISRDDPDVLIAVRTGSPLIIGVGRGENFIASDVPAILDRTRQVIYLKDREMAVLRRDSVEVSTFSGRRVIPKVDRVTFNIDAVQKQGFAHFMLKEIHEQPAVLDQMFKSRIKAGRIVLEGLGLSDSQLKQVKRIVLVACGTAYHAGLVGRYLVESWSGVPMSVDVSSEFRYRDPIIDKDTLLLTVSQSGETADTLAAVKEARAKGAKVISICNVVGSSLARESDGVLYTHAGPEIGVASTKAYTAQIAMLCLLALKLAGVKGALGKDAIRKILGDLKNIPSRFQNILKNKDRVAAVAKKNSHYGCFLFLGRNINFPTALEGALKLKEISYIPAEGYAAGEMKHGPIALIDEYRAVVCVAPQSDVYEKMVSNMQEIRARKGKIIAVATQGDTAIRAHAHDVFYIPPTNKFLTPLLAAIPLQLLAYYIAVKLGCDVDQPRNLAKSVTVE